MFARVLKVGLMSSLLVTLACASGSKSAPSCADADSASVDQVTELAMGVAHAFGAAQKSENRQAADALACSTQNADEVVIVTAG